MVSSVSINLVDRNMVAGKRYFFNIGYANSKLFMNPSSNAYSSPVVYTDSPLLSGYMSEENRTLVANSAGLVVDERGQGAVVLSLDSPTFRAFWWGTQRLLVNGIFFGDLLEEPR